MNELYNMMTVDNINLPIRAYSNIVSVDFIQVLKNSSLSEISNDGQKKHGSVPRVLNMALAGATGS
jgi:hypothetical protein